MNIRSLKTAITSAAMIFAYLAASMAVASDKSCDELINESESRWIKLEFEDSDKLLAEAKKICPDRAEIYWRMARNAYGKIEKIPRDRKPPKDELVERYNDMEKLADKCIELDEKDGNCWMYKGVAMGRRGTTQGILKTIYEVDDLEAVLLKALELKPQYRTESGAANSMGDLNSILGQMYRALPEWTCAFPFKTLIGTCGDLDKSVELQRKAVARESARIEYHKELAVSLMCRGQAHDRPGDVEEAEKIFNDMQSMNEFKITDRIDKEHAKMILADPSLACGYSRDAQQEQSREALEIRDEKE
jgi:hypothetical protein